MTDENFSKTFTVFLISMIQLNSILDTVSNSMISSIKTNDDKYKELVLYKNKLLESSNAENSKLQNLNQTYQLEQNKQNELQKRIDKLSF